MTALAIKMEAAMTPEERAQEAFKVFRRLMKNTRLDEGSGCWLWMGETDDKGYPHACGFGEPKGHRASYRLFVGPIPDGMYVCHKCDVRRCINPEHLFLGSAADNTGDAIRKGRLQRKLTLSQVESIRRLRDLGVHLHVIAERFGVSTSLVCAISKHKHVTAEAVDAGLTILSEPEEAPSAVTA